MDDTLYNCHRKCRNAEFCSYDNTNQHPYIGCKSCKTDNPQGGAKWIYQNFVIGEKECDTKVRGQDQSCKCVTTLVNDKLQYSQCNSDSALVGESSTICRGDTKWLNESVLIASGHSHRSEALRFENIGSNCED